MATVVMSNRDQFRAEQQLKIKRLNNQKSLTNTRIARFLQAQARLMSPYRSGHMAQSIRIRNLKNGGRQVRVWAQAESGFPYPKWVNRSPGYEVARNKFAGMRAIAYRDPALDWNWTGEAEFFTKAVNMTLRRWKEMAARDYAKALGIRVG